MSGNGIALDFRIALRQLRRNSALTLVCVAVLAFGLGANTAVFSALYKTVLEPLPYPQPSGLVAVHNRVPGLNLDRLPASPLDYLDLRAHRELFAEAGVDYFLDLTRTGIESPQKINAVAASSSLFRALGVPPLMGRLFNAAEEQFHGPHAVVLSEAYWRAEFGADPRILERSLQLDGETYPIVGVMSASFQFPNAVTQMWTPVTFSPDTLKAMARTRRYLHMYARLAPGVSVDQASAGMERLSHSMAAQLPDAYPLDRLGWRVFLSPMSRDDDGALRRWIVIMFAGVSCLLLIVCSNVAGLLLVRSTARQFELSVRVALGAGRWRIARLVLVEVLLVTMTAGAAAMLLARTLTALLSEYGPVGTVELEAPIYWFGLALAGAAGIACGLYPAWSATRSDAVASLKRGSAQRTSSRGQQRARQGLIIAQVAVATVLLVCGGLLTHSLIRLLQVPLGFDPQNVLTAEITLHGARYQNPGARSAFFRAVLEQTARIPGVDAASAGRLPFGYSDIGTNFQVPDKRRPAVDPYADVNTVLPGYFDAIRLPLLRGRAFSEQDGPGSEKVVIVDQALAVRYLPGEDPIGRHLTTPQGDFAIAGLVGSVKTSALDVDARPQLYFPAAQSNPSSMSLVIRSRLGDAAVIVALERIVHEVDPDQAVYNVAPLEWYIEKSFRPRRFVALLLSGIAVSGALLSAVGLYGLLSYAAALRRREAGIRMVLGAGPGVIAWVLCGSGAALVACGVALGSIAAIGLSSLVASQLFGTRVQDPAAGLRLWV